jgi:hypothetical protein
MSRGVTIGLCGESGSGKTTLAGEYAKYIKKSRGLKTKLYGADQGGSESLRPHERLGFLEIEHFNPQTDDPWLWLNNAIRGDDLTEDYGLAIIDSATAIGEACLANCAKLASEGTQLGGRPAPKFSIGRGEKALRVGANVDTHFLIVQTYIMDALRSSSWLTTRGIDVLWTFGVLRGEKQDEQLILGPKVVGKALTPHIPKEFNYFFTLTVVPEEDRPSRHILNLQEQPAILGGGSTGMYFGNSRYPLDAASELPARMEPASLVGAIELIQRGQQEAEDALRAELGL